MDIYEEAFRILPDTVIITDMYWYILDFNHSAPFERLRKGTNLSGYMPDCRALPQDKYRYKDGYYQRSTVPVYENGVHVGYLVCLADITENEKLLAQRQAKSEELQAITTQQAKANEELASYVRQARNLMEYEEQARIARSIHDDAGHAVTALHTISQMCLLVRESDPEKYRSLLTEGIDACRRAARGAQEHSYASLLEILETFRKESRFPVTVVTEGEEPSFVLPLLDVIHQVCKEAYHNTLAHSLADSMTIRAEMSPQHLRLLICDNGHFHGSLEKGYGLHTMEQNVRSSGGTIVFPVREGCGFEIIADWDAGDLQK